MIATCGTCKHWAEGAQGTEGFGTCQVVTDLVDPTLADKVFLADTVGVGSVWMETRPEFGCSLHSSGANRA